MREKRFVKGSTSEEKFRSIETTLRHFSHRMGRKIVGLIPATPVIGFMAPGDDGVVLNMICPANGKITQGCVYIESDKKLVSLGLRIRRKSNSEENKIKRETNKPLPFRLDREVRLGDMITLWVDEPEGVRNVWIGFLYEISPEGLGKKEFVREQLEKMEEDDALPTQEG